MPRRRMPRVAQLAVLALWASLIPLVAGSRSAGAAPSDGTPNVFPVPERGGLTIGPTGTSNPADLAAAQRFDVESISAWDVEAQRWWVYIPGAPEVVNAASAGRFRAESFAWIKRRDTGTVLAPAGTGPVGFPEVPSSAQALPSPPGSGITIGFAGTSDPAELAASQLFEVQTISVFDVSSQRWLTYVPGAPASVNSLTALNLEPGSVVFIRSREGSSVAPAPGASPTATATPSPTATAGAGRFETLPPGTPLPSGAECATRVRPAPEVRSDNAVYNATRGTSPHDSNPRVDGDYTGTTDEILQWGACKWGIDEDIVRAMAAIESWWHQWSGGDTTTNQDNCYPDLRTGSGECPESFGLLKVRYPYHGEAFEDGNAVYSSAYNVDYTLSVLRSCYEGEVTWLNTVERGAEYAAGDIWGCAGVWFSGRWYTEPAVTYIGRVQGYLNDRVWESASFIGS